MKSVKWQEFVEGINISDGLFHRDISDESLPSFFVRSLAR